MDRGGGVALQQGCGRAGWREWPALPQSQDPANPAAAPGMGGGLVALQRRGPESQRHFHPQVMSQAPQQHRGGRVLGNCISREVAELAREGCSCLHTPLPRLPCSGLEPRGFPLHFPVLLPSLHGLHLSSVSPSWWL